MAIMGNVPYPTPPTLPFPMPILTEMLLCCGYPTPKNEFLCLYCNNSQKLFAHLPSLRTSCRACNTHGTFAWTPSFTPASVFGKGSSHTQRQHDLFLSGWHPCPTLPYPTPQCFLPLC